MKFRIDSSILLAIASSAVVVALSSCKKPVADVIPEPEPPPISTPLPVATPAPATPIAVATPVPDPLAPPGIFFLLQKASITTDDGIIGLKPGQGLRQVSPGSYEVNGQTVQLRDDQVTNNLRIARQYASSDTATQTSIRQALQQKSAQQTSAEAKALQQSSSSQNSGRPISNQKYLPGVSKQASGLDSSSNLGAAHTRTKDGWLWQMDSSGNWVRVRPLGK